MISSAAPSRESLLRAAQSLPSAPRILAQLGRKIQDANCGLNEITTLLKCDAALTARIIRVSNSVMYRTGEAHGSLDEALLRLGLAEVYRITGFAGLLRSIGKVALDRWFCAPNSINGRNFFYHGTGPLEEWEIDHVGIPANEAAGSILVDWNFPESTATAVRNHYRPTPGDNFANLLNLAAGAAERCGHGWPGEWSYWDATEEQLAAAGVGADDLDAAMRRALELFGPVRIAVG
jgi:HD-like signal output (HDOD) protein